MPVLDPGGGGGGGGRGGTCHPPEEAVSVLFFAHYMSIMVWWRFGVFWGGLGCFNGPHDGYANRSKCANEFASRYR